MWNVWSLSIQIVQPRYNSLSLSIHQVRFQTSTAPSEIWCHQCERSSCQYLWTQMPSPPGPASASGSSPCSPQLNSSLWTATTDTQKNMHTKKIFNVYCFFSCISFNNIQYKHMQFFGPQIDSIEHAMKHTDALPPTKKNALSFHCLHYNITNTYGVSDFWPL